MAACPKRQLSPQMDPKVDAIRKNELVAGASSGYTQILMPVADQIHTFIQILAKPYQSGRLTKWAIELSIYYIPYRARVAGHRRNQLLLPSRREQTQSQRPRMKAYCKKRVELAGRKYLKTVDRSQWISPSSLCSEQRILFQFNNPVSNSYRLKLSGI